MAPSSVRGDLRVGDFLVVVGAGPKPNVPCDDTIEPAFGAAAVWIAEAHAGLVRRAGFTPIDNVSIVLTHLRELISANLDELLSYLGFRQLLERLDPEYRKLLEELVPAQISNSTLHAVMKKLLAERVSVRSLEAILEAIAAVAPHTRKPEQLVEQVRGRLSQQICGDISENGVLKIIRLAARLGRHLPKALRRDPRGEIVEFALDQEASRFLWRCQPGSSGQS